MLSALIGEKIELRKKMTNDRDEVISVKDTKIDFNDFHSEANLSFPTRINESIEE